MVIAEGGVLGGEWFGEHGDCLRHRRHSAKPEPAIFVAVSALRASVNYRKEIRMTSKVTIEAQSQPCEIRLMPRVGENDLWQTLSDETRRFACFVLPAGETRECHVHSGQSVLVREWSDTPSKAPELNRNSELRAAPDNPPGRYLFRGNGHWDTPYEAELLEWTAGGRLKLGAPGVPRWLEGRDIPFVVERIASADTQPEAGDAKQAPLVSGAVAAAKPTTDAQ